MVADINTLIKAAKFMQELACSNGSLELRPEGVIVRITGAVARTNATQYIEELVPWEAIRSARFDVLGSAISHNHRFILEALKGREQSSVDD